MKALITGSTGFVGGYLRRELESNGYQVIGTGRDQGSDHVVDITDFPGLKGLLETVKPDVIFHLAGLSSVRESFREPELCMQINVGGTQNLLQAITELGQNPRVLVVGSSDVYKVTPGVRSQESFALESSSPYGKSRIAQEVLLKNYPQINWVQTRSFPHIGPGQRQGFVTADFASQIVQVKEGDTIRVGTLKAVRDFTHVKDTVRAYRLLSEAGNRQEVFNVCSGREISIKEVLDSLIRISGKDIEIIQSADLIRPTDIVYCVGDNTKLKSIIDWEPEYTLEQTLTEIYEYWKNK